MSARLTVRETADFLRTLDNVLILTHVRPDGDTVGCAAALCRALRALGKTAYMLPNPDITETYEPYAAPCWAPEDFVPAAVVSVDIAALNLLPDNALPYKGNICLAIDHHGSQEFFAARTCLDADAAACGEVMYEIVRTLTEVTPDIAGAVRSRVHRHRLLRLRQHHRPHPPHRRRAHGAGHRRGPGEQGAVPHQIPRPPSHGVPHGLRYGTVRQRPGGGHGHPPVPVP